MNKRKYNRILLINCSLDKISKDRISQSVSSPNLGLLSISGVLLMHGYEVKIIDFFVEKMSSQKFHDFLKNYNPDLIGFSIYTRTMPFFDKMLKFLNKIEYQGKIAVGGPHPSFAVQEMLNTEDVDYVICGEGEFAFLLLLESLNSNNKYPINKAAGICYKKGEDIICNKIKDRIELLDALPLQPIDMINTNLYSSPCTLSTSRGCPGDCIYCASRALSGSVYRSKSAENIICEIIYLKNKLGNKKLTIVDDTFTADICRFNKFINLLKNSTMDLSYRIESRGDILSEELLDKLKETNCNVIHVGIESGSQYVLDRIGKKIDLDRTIKLLLYAQKLGIHMVASFIIGHYCDTEETIDETFNLMQYLKNNGIEVSVAICTPFPGTPIYNKAKRLGISIHANTWQEYDFGNVIISTQYLSQERLRTLLFKAIEICK